MSYARVENALWEIQCRIQDRTRNTRETENALFPLVWYISTGRAPTEFLEILVSCNKRQFTIIAKRLLKCGTYDDAINSVCSYIGFEREN